MPSKTKTMPMTTEDINSRLLNHQCYYRKLELKFLPLKAIGLQFLFVDGNLDHTDYEKRQNSFAYKEKKHYQATQ